MRKKEEKQPLGLKWNANRRCSLMGVIKKGEKNPTNERGWG
jgi:hypothetical protein